MATSNEATGAVARAGPPAPALALGYAGLLPPLPGIVLRASELMTSAGTGRLTVLLLVGGLIYGGLILSFLGGMWWGAACARPQGPALRPWLRLAVMPSLLALLGLAACVSNAKVGGALLAVALVTTLLVDRKLVVNAMVPDWWMALRVPLSCGLAAEMIATGLLA